MLTYLYRSSSSSSSSSSYFLPLLSLFPWRPRRRLLQREGKRRLKAHQVVRRSLRNSGFNIFLTVLINLYSCSKKDTIPSQSLKGPSEASFLIPLIRTSARIVVSEIWSSQWINHGYTRNSMIAIPYLANLAILHYWHNSHYKISQPLENRHKIGLRIEGGSWPLVFDLSPPPLHPPDEQPPWPHEDGPRQPQPTSAVDQSIYRIPYRTLSYNVVDKSRE